MTPLVASSLLVCLMALLPLRDCHAFVVVPPSTLAASTTTRTRTTSTVHNVIMMDSSSADMAEERKRKNNKKDKDDWTPVSGGFLPNLRRKTAKPKQDLVLEIQTLEDYKQHVVDEPNKLTVVRFYAPWCRACKAMAPKFKRLARQYSKEHDDRRQQVQFVEVPLNKQTAVLHQGLNVPSLPYGHIYHPQVGLVEEIKINKHVFNKFETVLQNYVDGSCNVNYDNDNDDGDNILQ